MTQTGAIKRFEYNQDRKLAMKDIGNGSINTYSYDTFGRIQNILNENANIVVSNENDKITQFAYPDHSINYTYNENNQITSIFTSSGYVVKYEYNDNGHIHYVKDKENRILLTADYTESGQVSKKILGNNATTIYKYDPVTGLLLDMLNYFPNGSVSSYFKYKYSVRNRRISVETHEGVWKFGYDRAGQVVSMIDPKGTRTEYSYDKRKNRKIISINGIEQNTVVNELNQYIKYGNTNFAYDKNGNLIRRNGTDEEYYTFDEDNKLVSFKTGTYNCRLKYDGLDNLYSKHCNGTTTRYVVNPLGNFGSDLIIKVTTKEGIEIKEEFYHGGEYIGLIAVRKGNGVLNYFQFDPLGSVLGILNENGELLNQYFSDPFGKDIASAESDKSSFTFVGQWGVIRIEEISGVFYMRSRFYDSVTGRFLSVDSFGIKAHSKNFYVYCSNSPVHFNDPGGNCPWCVVGSAVYGAAKNVLNYGMDTPYEDWTWGGAAGAAVTGGINGLVGGLGVGGKLTVAALAVAADVVGGYVQRKIDHQPNTWKEIKEDLVRSTVGQAKQFFENIPLVKEVRKHKCQLDINCQRDKILQQIERTADLQYKASKIIEWIRSHDPNDILGPPGFGAARFISKNSVLQYKIRFENDANATAPAQRVYIKHKYSQHLDQRTFLIGDFGFGNLTKTIPVGSKSFQGYIDLTNEIGAFVKVFAGIDVVNGIAVWEFQTIDPTTGEAPTDPLIGFLPPNNGTSGQGFVTFSMKPNPNVNHLAAIHANASIFFDNNEPIDTPNIINTIDKQSPNMTASVINGTETTESITISFKTADSGSGVKHVDIFQLQEEQFVMLKTGITENIFVLPLEPNDSFTLVAIAVDEVGNRMEIDEVDQSLFLTISFQPTEVNCSCSGNGICGENSDVCICKQGFYGPACNSTARPLEPPVLELKASSGYSNQPIPLTISARNLSGSREELHIVVSGIPQNTNFSQGQLSDDGYLTLKYTEFGALIMTTAQLGEITLIVEVNQRSNGFNFTRTETLNVMVYPRLYADIQVDGCFSENTKNEAVILLNSSISSNLSFMNSKNESSVIPHVVQMQVPPWIHPVGQFHDSGVYTLTDTVFNLILDLNGRLESVNISLTLTLKPDGAPTYTTRKDVAIKRFCSGDCDKFLYGLNCDKDCSCEEKNTVPPWCDRLTGSCTCAKEWIGDRCNETECKDGFYGISCEEKCSCKQNNTIECNRINGSCTCMPAWEGSDCETDVDECSNVTICDPQPHTVCQNKDWGYECLCMVGYELENNKCSASQPKESTTLSPEEASVIRLTSVVIHLDVNITTNVNLKAASTYKIYEEKAQTMLTNYYKKHLGDSFIRVIIRSLVKGSLVIDHNVETKNTKNVTHALTAAVVQMADPKASPLVFDGQNVNVKDLLVNNIKVSGPDGLCTAFMSVENCPTSCELDLENKPTCRSLDTKKDNTILIIAVTVPVGSVVVIALVITIVLCRRKANKKTKANITNGENHRFRRNYLDTDF